MQFIVTSSKTITIQHKVVSDYDENGQRKLYVETRLKTDSTRRTLPLIPHIERMLLEKKSLKLTSKRSVVRPMIKSLRASSAVIIMVS